MFFKNTLRRIEDKLDNVSNVLCRLREKPNSGIVETFEAYVQRDEPSNADGAW